MIQEAQPVLASLGTTEKFFRPVYEIKEKPKDPKILTKFCSEMSEKSFKYVRPPSRRYNPNLRCRNPVVREELPNFRYIEN